MSTTTPATPASIAAYLNNAEYPRDIKRRVRDMAGPAKAAGLVIAYGASDDRLEFYGAISDELSAYGGVTVRVTGAGLVENKCPAHDDCPHFDPNQGAEIRAIWEPSIDNGYPHYFGASWLVATEIPHSRFHINEGGTLFGRGIVFALALADGFDMPEGAADGKG